MIMWSRDWILNVPCWLDSWNAVTDECWYGNDEWTDNECAVCFVVLSTTLIRIWFISWLFECPNVYAMLSVYLFFYVSQHTNHTTTTPSTWQSPPTTGCTTGRRVTTRRTITWTTWVISTNWTTCPTISTRCLIARTSRAVNEW